MIIELPDKFFAVRKGNNFIRIIDGILEIKGEWNFEDLMILLTYRIKGKNRCYYCRKRVNEGKITVDHLFPKNFGGVTITNNLEPTCRRCNKQKTNMNQYEFGVWRGLKTKEEKNSYYRSIIAKKSRKIKNSAKKNGFDLPERWICYRKIENIRGISLRNQESKKYQKTISFAKKYNKLPRPLVISYNGVLLDGFTAYNVAIKMQFKKIPVIILENVVVL